MGEVWPSIGTLHIGLQQTAYLGGCDMSSMNRDGSNKKWKVLRDAKVMVVDDSRAMRLLMTQTLRMGGQCTDFREAENGAEALRILQDYSPDVMLLDLRMELLDGISTLREMRTHYEERIRFLPVLVITGYTSGAEVLAAMQYGAHGVVAKPITAKTLLDRVSGILIDPLPFVCAPGAMPDGKDFFGPRTAWAERDILRDRAWNVVVRQQVKAADPVDMVDNIFAEMGIDFTAPQDSVA